MTGPWPEHLGCELLEYLDRNGLQAPSLDYTVPLCIESLCKQCNLCWTPAFFFRYHSLSNYSQLHRNWVPKWPNRDKILDCLDKGGSLTDNIWQMLPRFMARETCPVQLLWKRRVLGTLSLVFSRQLGTPFSFACFAVINCLHIINRLHGCPMNSSSKALNIWQVLFCQSWSRITQLQ